MCACVRATRLRWHDAMRRGAQDRDKRKERRCVSRCVLRINRFHQARVSAQSSRRRRRHYLLQCFLFPFLKPNSHDFFLGTLAYLRARPRTASRAPRVSGRVDFGGQAGERDREKKMRRGKRLNRDRIVVLPVLCELVSVSEHAHNEPMEALRILQVSPSSAERAREAYLLQPVHNLLQPVHNLLPLERALAVTRTGKRARAPADEHDTCR